MAESTTPGGIPCPQCGSFHRKVIESRRKVIGKVYRRYVCGTCGNRYTTYERLAGEQPHAVCLLMAKVRDHVSKLDDQIKEIESLVEESISTSLN